MSDDVTPLQLVEPPLDGHAPRHTERRPPSRADRWQPTRAGLVSLWRYWDETFELHGGRLLLRGPNGSGKSMALELLLPFLFDADASPGRLTSAARSRGGLYERVMTGTDDPNRAGFAWVELRRGDATFTVGARLRASASTRKVDLDFFTTTQAVGRDLHLLDAQRAPLSRKALVEAIGAHGQVHASAEDHRAAVRTALFPGFSADRYASVIGALLALRKEKLSQNLDLDKLSEVLTEALPPVDDHDLTTVAEGFERLDRRRAELARLEAELAEVRTLAAHQRRYAEAVLATVADAVRTTETARDQVTRREREAGEELAGLAAAAAGTEAQLRATVARLERADAEQEALRDSEAYRQGASMDDLRSEVADLQRRVTESQARVDRSELELAASTERATEAWEEWREADARWAGADAAVRGAAGAVGADGLVDEAQRVAGPPARPDAHDLTVDGGSGRPDEARTLVAAWLRTRRDRVAEVRRAVRAHDQAEGRRDLHAGAVSGAEADVEDRRQVRADTAAAFEEASSAFGADVQTWAATAEAVGVARVQSALPAPPLTPDALTAAVADLRRDLAAEQAAARTVLAAEQAALDDRRVALEGERTEVAAGGLTSPAPPPWRAERPSDRPGAPLWQLVDVAGAEPAGGQPGSDGADATGSVDGPTPPPGPADRATAGSSDTTATTDPATIDGLEAALEAAGLLDAWVAPDGRVDLPASVSDVALAATAPVPHPLRRWLEPVADGRVPPGVVEAVLASIAVADTAPPPPSAADDPGPAPGDAPGGPPSGKDRGQRPDTVVIGRDGSFRAGSAWGRGHVRPARLLGAAARERRRLARLAELDDELRTLAAEQDRLAGRVADLERQAAAAEAHLAAVPDGSAVLAAEREADLADRQATEADGRLHAARRVLAEAEDQVRQALRTLTTEAARHRLPVTVEGLAEVEGALGNLERATDAWLGRHRELRSTARLWSGAAADAARQRRTTEEALTEHDTATARHLEREARLVTLEASIGAEYQALLDQVATLDAERREGRARRDELQRTQLDQQRRLGVLEGALQEAAASRERAEAARDEAHHRFAAAVADGLVEDAGLPTPASLDGVTAVLAAARSAAGALPEAASSEQAEERRSAKVEEQVHHAQGLLGGRVDLSRELVDGGWWVLRASVAGLRRRVSELEASLASDLDAGHRELADDEEELFEQTLAGSVRRALADRIRRANQLVDAINGQLDQVRTQAGGVAVRLRWEVAPDQPEAVRAARALLLRDPADLTEDQRSSLQDFVRARVEQARADLEANAPWEARLRETLDYRAWHRFALQLAHRDWEGYQPATARRLQRLSTGERSIALHLPMLASIAAHYADDDGEPSGCPRLILLDELFAGVDTANRAQLFGTFTAWDLDAVFTSDHEWCQYATLDAIAIHHLHPPEGSDPVTSTRFTWDGRARTVDPVSA